jgi:hypothetical protein
MSRVRPISDRLGQKATGYQKRPHMSIEPVQVILLGFRHPDLHGRSSRRWNGCARTTPFA